jgi:electron transport complex protein RnfD
MNGIDLSLSRIPQIHMTVPTATRMWLVSLCSFLVVLQSSLTDSFSSLFIALAAVVTGVFVEWIVGLSSKRHTLKDGSAVASALVFSLMLPHQIHPLYAVFGTLFAILVVKHSFGGLGTNWLNPAIGGWLFIRFSWPKVFTEALQGSPLSTLAVELQKGIIDPSGSPLGILKIAGFKGSPTDTVVTDTLNSTVFSRLGAQMPGGYVDYFSFSGSGIIADRGIGLLLLGTVLILALAFARVWIPALFLLCYTTLVRLFGALPLGGSWGSGDMLFGLLTGGTLVAAFLMALDPATGPKSNVGAAVIVVFTALAAYFFRYLGMDSYGAFLAIALGNVFVPLIREWESHSFYGRNRRS